MQKIYYQLSKILVLGFILIGLSFCDAPIKQNYNLVSNYETTLKDSFIINMIKTYRTQLDTINLCTNDSSYIVGVTLRSTNHIPQEINLNWLLAYMYVINPNHVELTDFVLPTCFGRYNNCYIFFYTDTEQYFHPSDHYANTIHSIITSLKNNTKSDIPCTSNSHITRVEYCDGTTKWENSNVFPPDFIPDCYKIKK